MILSVFAVDWKKYSIKMKALLDADDNGTMSPLFWAKLLEIPMIEDNDITPTCLFSLEDSASFVDKLDFPVRLVCNQNKLMYIFEMSNGERLGFQSLGQAKQRQHNYLFPYLLPFACHKARGENHES